MSATRRLMLGLVLATAMAAPALAEDSGTDGQILTVWPNGKISAVPLFGGGVAGTVMRHATAMNGPVMVLTRGGKTYMVENARMSDGRMLLDYLNDPAYKGGGGA